MKIALIGCGAIGAGVLELLHQQPRVQVGWLVVRSSQERAQALLQRYAPQARLVTELQAHDRPDLLVECAGHGAIASHVLPALARGIPAAIASVGALSEPGLAERLEQVAAQSGAQVQLLSGAIGAIDALSAARLGGLDSVVYTGRKPALAWLGTPAEQHCDLARLEHALCIFEGSARRAAQLFPKNANVAATVSLAGLGLERTQVRLWADPAVQDNVHQIEAHGAFGALELTLKGRPLAANPKTSALTVYSVARAVLNRAASLAI